MGKDSPEWRYPTDNILQWLTRWIWDGELEQIPNLYQQGQELKDELAQTNSMACSIARMMFQSIADTITALRETGASDKVITYWIGKYLDLQDPAVYNEGFRRINPIEWTLTLLPQFDWLWQNHRLGLIKRAYSLMMPHSWEWCAQDFAQHANFSDDPGNFGLVPQQESDAYAYAFERVRLGALSSERDLVLLQLRTSYVTRYTLVMSDEAKMLVDPRAIRELLEKCKSFEPPLTSTEIRLALGSHISELEQIRSYNPISYKLDDEGWRSQMDKRIAEIEAIIAEYSN